MPRKDKFTALCVVITGIKVLFKLTATISIYIDNHGECTTDFFNGFWIIACHSVLLSNEWIVI